MRLAVLLIVLCFANIMNAGCGGDSVATAETTDVINNSVPGSNETERFDPTTILFENDYVSAKIVDKIVEVTIKKTADKIVCMRDDGEYAQFDDIANVSYNDFINTTYVLLPKNHWFAKLFIDNPFDSLSNEIMLSRPNLWGKELKIAKIEKNSVLFKTIGPLSPPRLPWLSLDDVERIFGVQTLLGRGGEGEVFTINFNGNEYALKRNASEFEDLEKLQFTNAIVEVYGAFQSAGGTYMLMKKGEKSLKDMYESKEKLGVTLINNSLQSMRVFIDAIVRLQIPGKDIKPANLIVTSNRIKIIDLSSNAFTKGYTGNSAELLAQSLLGAAIGKSFTGGRISLDRYYGFRGDYRDENVASPDYMSYWSRYLCEKRKLSDDCSDVDNFDKVYERMNVSELSAIAQESNAKCDSADWCWHLPFPQLLKNEDIKWDLREVKQEIFRALSEDHIWGEVFPTIFMTEFADTEKDIGTALLNLYRMPTR